MGNLIGSREVYEQVITIFSFLFIIFFIYFIIIIFWEELISFFYEQIGD